MKVKSHADVEKVRSSVTEWRRLSDRLFSVGPFGVGLDGLLTWVPGIGGVYGLGVGGYLLAQAARVRASRGTMVKMGLLMGADALVGEIPLVGDAFDFFFRAHARSARILLKEIEQTHYAPAGAPLEHHEAQMRANPGKRRLVVLDA